MEALERLAATAGEPRRLGVRTSALKVMALDLAPLLGLREPLIVSGRGTTSAASRRACLGEAAERLALEWDRRLACVRARLSALEAPAVVPAGIDWGQRPWDWLPVEPMNGGPARLAPACLVYLGHPQARRLPARLKPDSSGTAAGASRADATRRALLELIERDAVAAWWHGRERRAGFGPASLGERRLDRFSFELAARGRLVWFLLLGSPHGVPVVAAVSARLDGEAILLGTAAGESLPEAALKAAGELAQNILGMDDHAAPRPRQGRARFAYDWLSRVRLRDEPHLLPAGEAELLDREPVPRSRPLLRALAEQGAFVYRLRMSSHGVPVARLLATGLSTPRSWASSENPWPYPF